MPESTIRPMSLLALAGIYFALFAAMVVLLIVLTYFIPFENPAMGLIVTYVAAMTTAQIWVNREKSAPSGKRQWNATFACGVVASLIMGALGYVSVQADEQLVREIGGDGPLIILVMTVALLVVNTLLVRLGFWFGVRQSVKGLARKA